jgi:hypothetical protein
LPGRRRGILREWGKDIDGHLLRFRFACIHGFKLA